jgi:hypothetical protein
MHETRIKVKRGGRWIDVEDLAEMRHEEEERRNANVPAVEVGRCRARTSSIRRFHCNRCSTSILRSAGTLPRTVTFAGASLRSTRRWLWTF